MRLAESPVSQDLELVLEQGVGDGGVVAVDGEVGAVAGVLHHGVRKNLRGKQMAQIIKLAKNL